MSFSIIQCIFRHAFIDTPIDVECWDKNERLTGLRLLQTFFGPQGVLSAAITPWHVFPEASAQYMVPQRGSKEVA